MTKLVHVVSKFYQPRCSFFEEEWYLIVLCDAQGYDKCAMALINAYLILNVCQNLQKLIISLLIAMLHAIKN